MENVKYIDGFEIRNGKVRIPIPCPDNIIGCGVCHYKFVDLEEYEDNKERARLVQELRYAIPSRRMLDVVNMGVVKVDDELIVIKNRYDYEPHEDLLMPYNEKHEMGYRYDELLHKSVLFDLELFGRRGRDAVMNYMAYHEFKYCQNCGKKLDKHNDEYHRQWGTCDMYCYGTLVGAW